MEKVLKILLNRPVLGADLRLETASDSNIFLKCKTKEMTVTLRIKSNDIKNDISSNGGNMKHLLLYLNLI